MPVSGLRPVAYVAAHKAQVSVLKRPDGPYVYGLVGGLFADLDVRGRSRLPDRRVGVNLGGHFDLALHFLFDWYSFQC